MIWVCKSSRYLPDIMLKAISKHNSDENLVVANMRQRNKRSVAKELCKTF